MNSEYKRNIIFRKAQGKIVMESYLNKITEITGQARDELTLLSLEETDLIINKLKAINPMDKIEVIVKNMPELCDFMTSKTHDSDFYLLIDEDWKNCGVCFIKSGVIFNGKYDFDKMVSDEIRVISSDFSFQIQSDYESGDIYCEFIRY